ncbi:MAG: hypothetical protein WDZ90_03160 [Candidatus Paceibacterota bacterium]
MNIFGGDKVDSKVISWALVIGIVVVLNLFFSVGIALVYEKPEFNTFCGNNEQVVQPIETKEQCLAVGGQWIEGTERTPSNGHPVLEKPLAGERQAYCNEFFTCQKEYEDAREMYERNVFIILLGLGVLSIIAGLAFKTFAPVSNGLTFGGILAFIIAAIRYWESADDLVKFGMLGLALAALIWIGIKKIKS